MKFLVEVIKSIKEKAVSFLLGKGEIFDKKE
jgi:hypothetical protein